VSDTEDIDEEKKDHCERDVFQRDPSHADEEAAHGNLQSCNKPAWRLPETLKEDSKDKFEAPRKAAIPKLSQIVLRESFETVEDGIENFKERVRCRLEDV
jgi:hypothetical protein